MSDEPTTPAEPTGEPAEPTAPAQEPSTTEPEKTDEPKGTDGPDWKAKARQWEDRAKENKKALDKAAQDQATTKKTLDAIAVALGLKKGEEVDPQKLADQLTAERDKAAKDAQDARVELTVFRAADTHKADAGALLDSREFMRDVAELDPSAKDFNAELAALIKQRVKDNPTRYGRPEQGPPKKSGPAGMTGGQGAPARSGSLYAAVQAATKST